MQKQKLESLFVIVTAAALVAARARYSRFVSAGGRVSAAGPGR